MAPWLRTVNPRRRCVRHLPIQRLKRREPGRTVPRRVVRELHCSPASSPSIAGVHANTPPRWEWRRCLPTTIYSRARGRAPKAPEAIPPTPPRDRRPSFVKTQRRTARLWASALDVAPRMSRMGVAKVPPHDHLPRALLRAPKSPRPSHQRPPETGVRHL